MDVTISIMFILNEDTAARFTYALSDAKLVAILWENDERDLIIRLISGDGRPAELRCSEAHGVKIDLKFELHHTGMAFSLDSAFKKMGGGWHLLLWFPAEGSIEVNFTEATLQYLEAA